MEEISIEIKYQSMTIVSNFSIIYILQTIDKWNFDTHESHNSN